MAVDPAEVVDRVGLVEGLRELKAGSGKSTARLAADSGLSTSGIEGMLAGKNLPTEETISRFAKACGLPSPALWVRARNRVARVEAKAGRPRAEAEMLLNASSDAATRPVPDSPASVAPLLPAAAVDAPVRRIRPRRGIASPPEVFVGRQFELAGLDVALAAGAGVITQNQAVTGLGGIGKSTLAARWIADHDADFNPIWWVHAESPQQVDPGLAELARELHPALKAVPDLEAAGWCRDWLRSHEGWLLVLDNVTAPGDVKGLIKDCPQGRFLLTSRTTVGWKDVAIPTLLDVLAPAEAVELLRKLAAVDRLDGAEQLCEALGYLPLGIEVAAAYMEETGVSASAYLRLLETDSRSGVLAWAPVHGDAQRTVARIWQISLDRINAHHGDLPGRLLDVLAWYATDDIPVGVVYGIDGLEEARVNEALGRLAAYALITRRDEAVAVHRLVQAVARAGHRDSSGGPEASRRARASRDIAVQALLKTVPRRAEPATWVTWRRLLPHIDALAGHIHPHEDDAPTAQLLAHTTTFLHQQGVLGRAVPLFERTMAGVERVLGPDHPVTLASRNNLAYAYQSAGDLGLAVPLFERTLADRERVLGPDHPGTLTSWNNLACAYESAGDLDRAVLLHERTLADRERVLGPDHPDTLASRNNLAYAYELAGELDRAVPLFERALTDSERVLGLDHPTTRLVRENLEAVRSGSLNETAG